MEMLLRVLCMFSVLGAVAPHGRLILPPARSCMWRYGYDTPKNYNDNALFCGGRARQWENNEGKCGLCGDSYDDPFPRSHEAGGIFATGTLAGNYRQNQVIRVVVEVTANHGGYFEFRLCPLRGNRAEATEACFNRYQLSLLDNTHKWTIPSKAATNFTIGVKLPEKVTCDRCVIQWKWVTANSWGCNKKGTCCIGCGPQEHFVNCADISVGRDSSPRSGYAPPVKPRAPVIHRDKPVALVTNEGRDQPVATIPPIPAVQGHVDYVRQTFTGARLGIQPVVTRSRSRPHAAQSQQQRMYAVSGFTLGTNPQAARRGEENVHLGQDYSSRRTSSSKDSRITSFAQDQTAPVSRRRKEGSNRSLSRYNGLANAHRSKKSGCQLKYRLSNLSINCAELCKRIGSSCRSRKRVAIIDAACNLMCVLV